ncbi:hypothetical protein LTS18_015069, partial [Coniosporium uncinatum]
ATIPGSTNVGHESEPILRRTSSEIKRFKQGVTHTSYLTTIAHEFRTLPTLVLARPNFRLLLLIFLLAQLSGGSTTILIIYITKRYAWTYANAGYFLSAKASVNITLLTIIIPLLVRYASTRRSMLASRIDFLGAEASLFISVVGALFIALSTHTGFLVMSLIIYALGSALPMFTMSLVKAPTIAGEDADSNAKDYSIVMLAKTVGQLIGIPLMTAIWAQGIGLGGIWLGAPYAASA